jgi:uncharacterized membrane protein
MADDTTTGLAAPNLSDCLRAGVETFKKHAKVLVAGFGIFFGANLLLGVVLQLLAGSLGVVLMFVLSIASVVPSLLLLPGLYSMALKAARDQKPELRDLLLMFNDRFIHHLGMLLLQSCGALVCGIGVIVTQALFIPGSFLVIDRKLDWDGAMQTCIESLKPKLVNWIVFHLVLAVIAFVGVLVCLVGVLVTGPVVLCAWAHGYQTAFKDFSAARRPAP